MAIINDTGNGMYMPVAPAYGGGYGGMFGGAGNDWWGILLLIALLNGGMFGGLGGWGGAGMFGGLGIDFPWLMNGQQNIQTNTNNGFRDAMLNDGITGIRDSIVSLASQLCTCCGDIREAIGGVNLNIAQTGNNITGAVRDGFYGAEIAANNRQMASMQQGFALQSGLAENRHTISTEACANRTAGYQNTRDIIDNQNRVGQSILDKLCQLELDNVKGQSAAKDREIDNLRTELLYARGEASRIANADSIVDRVYTRLKDCPVDTVPVFGNQRIWSCTQPVNNGCGCGNNGFGFAA